MKWKNQKQNKNAISTVFICWKWRNHKIWNSFIFNKTNTTKKENKEITLSFLQLYHSQEKRTLSLSISRLIFFRNLKIKYKKKYHRSHWSCYRMTPLKKEVHSIDDSIFKWRKMEVDSIFKWRTRCFYQQNGEFAR